MYIARQELMKHWKKSITVQKIIGELRTGDYGKSNILEARKT